MAKNAAAEDRDRSKRALRRLYPMYTKIPERHMPVLGRCVRLDRIHNPIPNDGARYRMVL